MCILFKRSKMSDFYLVRKGDNLTKIARKYNTSVKELLKLNPNLKNGGNLIFVGDKINLPFKNVEDIDINVKGFTIERTTKELSQDKPVAKQKPQTQVHKQVPVKPMHQLQVPKKLQSREYESVRDSLTQKIDKNFDVRTPFLGTAEDLEVILKNTPLKGQGKNFLAAQEKYGVNALFMIAISQTESTFGKHTPGGRNKGNFAGLTIRNIETFDECIDKLGDNFANGKYFYKKGKTTINEIAPTYCPPRKERWGNWARDFINNYNKKILNANYS